MHGKAKRRRINAAMLCADTSGLEDTLARWARGHKGARQPYSSMDYAWSIYQEEQAMAVSGGMTNAYRCNVIDGNLIAAPTTYPTRDCANVEAALEILARGETCIVAAADMSALRARRLAEKDRASA